MGAEVEEKIIETSSLLNNIFMLPAESEKTADLLEALIQASKEFKPVKSSGVSKVPYTYKYITLEDMKAATDEALSQHKLRIIHQEMPVNEHKWLLVTTLRHSSGQWLASYAPIEIDPTPEKGFSSRQGWGKEITYAKKYQIGLLLNLSPDDDTDATPSEKPKPKSDEKHKQCPAEIKSWTILNELGIDQAAWKQDMYEKYSISSMAELEPKTWSKISNALEKYQEYILLICDHWQCVSKELREFLVYKFGHRIGESFDTLHEALNSENGKMAELYEEFKVWKESPEEESEDESGELPAQETSEPSEISEQDKLLAQIREVLEAAGHDSTYIENRLQGLAHQKADALKKALATAKKQAKNGNGNQAE